MVSGDATAKIDPAPTVRHGAIFAQGPDHEILGPDGAGFWVPAARRIEIEIPRLSSPRADSPMRLLVSLLSR